MNKSLIRVVVQVILFIVALGLAVWLIFLDTNLGYTLLGMGFIIVMMLFVAAKPNTSSPTVTLPPPPVKPSPPQKPSPIEDVGFIAYWGEQSAYLYRTQAIPNTAHAIQPYVQLHITQASTYSIIFNIFDADGVLVFTHSVAPLLVQATNFILSPTRLPLSTLPNGGATWNLQVFLNGTVTTTHKFTWHNDTIDHLAGNINSDGEIDESILPLLADNYAQPMSLDDLLAGKNDSPITSKARDVQP